MSEQVQAVQATVADPATTTKARRRGFVERRAGLVYGSLSMLALILLWELAWQMGWISPLFFSGPSAVTVRFWELSASGALGRDLAYSGTNFAIGFGLALVVGVPLGVVLGWYRRLLLLFDPMINALYATPRIALYPLIIVWFGIGSSSKIFIVFLSAVLPVLINTLAGVRNLDPDLLKAARAFCARDRQIFVTVALPSSVPFILTGVRQGVALGLIGVIVGEIFAGNRGIGYMIAYSGQMFQTDTLLVGVVCTATAGIVLTAIAEQIQRRFQRWRPSHVGGN